VNKEAKPVFVIVKWGERRGLIIEDADTPKEALELAKEWLGGVSGYVMSCEKLEATPARRSETKSLPPAAACFAKAANLAAEPWKRP
jgi:hypothetical protein